MGRVNNELVHTVFFKGFDYNYVHFLRTNFLSTPSQISRNVMYNIFISCTKKHWVHTFGTPVLAETLFSARNYGISPKSSNGLNQLKSMIEYF